MKTIALAALLGFSAAENLFLNNEISDIEHEFLKYVAKNHKNYGTKEEYEFRLAQFAKNFEGILELNQTNGSFTTAPNQFADWTKEEYKQLLGFKQTANLESAETVSFVTDAVSVDWRKNGAVTHVKNQGQCGSCWSFSTTGAAEGAIKLAGRELPILSEQQLVDCATYDAGYGSFGCQGGQMSGGLQYIIDNHDSTESEYPYTATNGTCDSAKVAAGTAKLTGYSQVTRNSSADLKGALAQGPVSVAIEADQMSFQFYSGGILDSGCGTNLDHGVLAVGYGSDAGQEYYIVKNSWGPTWGDQGYIKLAIQDGAGVCGIQMQPLLAHA